MASQRALAARSSGRRHGFRLAVSVFLLAVLLPAARAELQFDVFWGFDGAIRSGNWFPVTVEVKNDGPSFTGVVEVYQGMVSGNTRRTVVELPTGTLKRITIPVFAASVYGGEWTARLVTMKKKKVAERLFSGNQSRRKSGGAMLLGALSRTPSGLPVFPSMIRNQPERQPEAARLLPALFPDHPVILGGLRAVYLNSERALDLKAPQSAALMAWLHGGGHLIIGIEQITDVNATPWLRGLIPGRLTGQSRIRSLRAFGDWLKPWLPDGKTPDSGGAAWEPGQMFVDEEMETASGEFPEAKVTAAADGIPLAVEAPCGFGRVTVLLFSPERQPFLGWKGRPWFWAKLTGLPADLFVSKDHQNESGWGTDAVFGSMIESRQIRKLPLAALLLLLGAYLAVIGPVDYFWLKRINRWMLTWITFPCYVAGFSALIYFIGFKLRAGDSEWNEFHITDILPVRGQTLLRGQTYASVYSPANQRYPVRAAQQWAALRGEHQGWGYGREDNDSQILQAGNTFTADLFVPVWTSQLYVNDWYETSPQAPADVAAEMTAEGCRVKITNRLDRKLADIRLCTGGRIHEAGELPPGQSREIVLPKNGGMKLETFVGRFRNDFSNAAMQRRRTFGGNNELTWNQSQAAAAACFLAWEPPGSESPPARFSAPGGLDLSAQAGDGRLIVLAWDADHSPVPPMNQFTPRRGSKNTLFRWIVSIQ